MVTWTYGDLNILHVHDDKTGYLTEKKIGTRAVYRFIYKLGTKVGSAASLALTSQGIRLHLKNSKHQNILTFLRVIFHGRCKSSGTKPGKINQMYNARANAQ